MDTAEVERYAQARLSGNEGEAWSYVKVQNQMNEPFEALGMESVLLFQDTAGLSGQEEKVSLEAQSEEASEEDQPEEENKPGESLSQEQRGGIWLDVPSLAEAANLLTQTLGLYMQML